MKTTGDGMSAAESSGYYGSWLPFLELSDGAAGICLHRQHADEGNILGIWLADCGA
jgi:hypothetical protein